MSIIEAKGYCYGWHFYQAGDACLVISSDDALFGHPAFRYVGWGPLTGGTFDKGLNNVVKDNDVNFPPEWRLSRSGRAKA